MEVDALKSELLEELGIMILFACGMHVSSTFLIVLFHIRELLYTKFCLVISRLNFGRHLRRFDILGLRLYSSYNLAYTRAAYTREFMPHGELPLRL